MDPSELARAVARLSLAATGDFDVTHILRELCEVASATVGVDGAGVMSSTGQGSASVRTRFVHADSPAADEVERLQEALREGPCHDAVARRDVVAVADVAEEVHRWPGLVDRAVELGLRSVLAVPLRSRGRTWATLDLYRRRTGDWAPAEREAAQLLADVAVSFLVMAYDRDVARAAQEELQHRSLHDQLTGLPNRQLLTDRIEHAVAAGRRRPGSVALMFIDLDRFKRINDQHGHAAGDRVLVEVSRRMAANLRHGDTLARLAGDEFILLCEDLPHGTGSGLDRVLTSIVTRLQAAFVRPVHIGATEVSISASVGVAIASGDPTAQELLADADAAMYQAKGRGRGGVVIHDHGTTVTGGGQRLAHEVVHALDRDQLRVHYQPIVDPDGRIRGVEALVRWQHPEHGLLAAGAFIGLAQGAGVLPQLGRWVVERSCADLAAWRREFDAVAPAAVFCNFTPGELSDPSLVASIDASLRAHDLDPADLVIEVLEASFAEPLLPVVARYQRVGHGISVDDFGTGYSSLSRLVDLPAAYAKIDRSFVAALSAGDRGGAFVEAVLTVARSLGLQVIAEGVETEQERAALLRAGCELLQGFHLVPPVPADRVRELLALQPA